MTKRFGFTLAEVLITLGIIGVVAAMTMPTLINQTNGAQYKAAYKKALSAISQAVTLNVALDDIGFAEVVKGSAGSTEAPSTTTNGVKTITGASVASMLKDRMNVVDTKGAPGYAGFPASIDTGVCTQTTGSGDNAVTSIVDCTGATTDTKKTIVPTTSLFFNDGSMFAFVNDDAVGCTQIASDTANNKICYGVIDVNGAKGPNKVVTCNDGKENSANCEVKSPTDIYPVVFYDQTILPASNAARAVLYGK